MIKASSEFLSREWLNVLESLDDGVLVVDADGSLEFINEGGAELAGIAAYRSIGRPVQEVLVSNAWLIELLETTLETGVRNVRADGVLKDTQAPWRSSPVRAAVTLLSDARGQRVGTLLTIQDTSYQRELESRSRESERLQQLEILVAGLAHEVKNPLSGMKGAAQILEAAIANTPRTKECTDILLHEIERLSNLIGQLLDIAGPSRLETRSVNIHELLDQVVLTLQPGISSGVHIERAFDPSLPPVRVDVSRLIQVLMNLIRNAVEASGDHTTITLRTRMESSYRVGGKNGRAQFLSVEISDQGPGIPEQNLNKIFNPFFTTKDDGTGLGLAISQRIITEHGGVLRVQPRKQGGAAFTLTLPVERIEPND
jgi:two-component system nitrogen regulation sensor histidine kinase GlnL